MSYKEKQKRHRRQAFACDRCNKPFAVISQGKITSALRVTGGKSSQCGECASKYGSLPKWRPEMAR